MLRYNTFSITKTENSVMLSNTMDYQQQQLTQGDVAWWKTAGQQKFFFFLALNLEASIHKTSEQ